MPKCRKKHNKNRQIYFFLTQSVEESDTHGSEPHTTAEDLRALRRRSVGRRSSVRRSVLGPVRAAAPVGRASVVGVPRGARPVAPSPGAPEPSFRFSPAGGAAAAFRPPPFGAAAGASLLSGRAPPGALRSGAVLRASPSSLLPSSLCLACSSLRGGVWFAPVCGTFFYILC